MKIIFVYNANSGLWNTFLDMGHKIISPKTYPCKLCDLSYGIFSVREEWVKYMEETKNELEFLHKDEFFLKYPQLPKLDLPVIFQFDGKHTSIILNAEQFKNIHTCAQLIQKLKNHEQNRR